MNANLGYNSDFWKIIDKCLYCTNCIAHLAVQYEHINKKNLNGNEQHDSLFALLYAYIKVLDLISSDNVNVPSEEEVYRAVLSWVKHDIDGRRQHVPWVTAGFSISILNYYWTVT